MNLRLIIDRLSRNKEWVFSGIGVAILGILWTVISQVISPTPSVDVNAIVNQLVQAERAVVWERGQHALEVQKFQDRVKELTEALQALQKDQTTPRADIKNAFEKLKRGDTKAAELIFQRVLDEKKAAGKEALKGAATAALNLGALAYEHDKDKALAAYMQAVELDPLNPEGWFRVGVRR